MNFPFKFNEENERRSLRKLYDKFRKKIKEELEMSAECMKKIERLDQVITTTNIFSHDNNNYEENLSDLRSIYTDLIAFDKIFRCTEGACREFVSLSSNKSTEDFISCKCGHKKLKLKV